jgi:hypothetical protein
VKLDGIYVALSIFLGEWLSLWILNFVFLLGKKIQSFETSRAVEF